MTPGLLDSRAAETATDGNSFHQAVRSVERALHDIGQPLTSIALAVELLLHEPDAEVRQSMLLTARKECSRAIRDITELRAETTNLLRLAETTEEVEG
jgi:signal transduction histidine kinase